MEDSLCSGGRINLSHKKRGKTLEMNEDLILQHHTSNPKKRCLSPIRQTQANGQSHLTEEDKEVQKEAGPTSHVKASKSLYEDDMKACFPSAGVVYLEKSVMTEIVGHYELGSFDVEGGMAMFDFSPPLALVVAETPEDMASKTVKNFGNILSRELTSVLQSKMPDPICIVPVFVYRQQLRERNIQSVVSDTLSSAEQQVPFSRWLMTKAKCEALRHAVTEVLKRP